MNKMEMSLVIMHLWETNYFSYNFRHSAVENTEKIKRNVQ